jgi:ribosome-binding protein aMBF1 (putative translation factor)
MEEESDLRDIREARNEPLYDQKEAEEYIFMNPVKRERMERGWTQEELARRIGVKQAQLRVVFHLQQRRIIEPRRR